MPDYNLNIYLQTNNKLVLLKKFTKKQKNVARLLVLGYNGDVED